MTRTSPQRLLCFCQLGLVFFQVQLQCGWSMRTLPTWREPAAIPTTLALSISSDLPKYQLYHLLIDWENGKLLWIILWQVCGANYRRYFAGRCRKRVTCRNTLLRVMVIARCSISMFQLIHWGAGYQHRGSDGSEFLVQYSITMWLVINISREIRSNFIIWY